MTKVRPRKGKEENKIKYGLELGGFIRVFSKTKNITSKKGKSFEITEYWYNVSKKDENDKWVNKSMRVFFPKDMDRPENNSLIFVEEANLFLSGNEGYERISLYVKEWDYVND